MKRLFGVVALASMFAGCAAVTNVENFLTAPQTVATAAQLKGWTEIVACSIATGADVAGQIESAVKAGAALQDTNGNVYLGSSIACQALGGTAVSSTPVAVTK